MKLGQFQSGFWKPSSGFWEAIPLTSDKSRPHNKCRVFKRIGARSTRSMRRRPVLHLASSAASQSRRIGFRSLRKPSLSLSIVATGWVGVDQQPVLLAWFLVGNPKPRPGSCCEVGSRCWGVLSSPCFAMFALAGRPVLVLPGSCRKFRGQTLEAISLPVVHFEA